MGRVYLKDTKPKFLEAIQRLNTLRKGHIFDETHRIMKPITYLILFGFLVLSACQKENVQHISSDHTDIQLIQFSHDNPIIPGKYIVRFKDEVVPASKFKRDMNYDQKVEVVRQIAAEIQEEYIPESYPIEYAYHTTIKGFAGHLDEAVLEKLMDDPRVLSIEADRIWAMAPPPGKGKPDKGDGGDGGDGSNSQSTPWGISRVNGGVSYNGTAKAWILDSGVDLDHPDLNVNTSLSKSFLGGKQANNPDDQNGHGTHVAGTIAAIDNNQGVIGVAAGAEVVSVRVLDRRGSGTTSGVIAGVDYVAQNASGGDVANMSLTGGVSSSLDAAVLSASSSCDFILAAGNDGIHANNRSPARVNGNNVYTVSAMSSNGNWASFSNYGNPPVDYCEPGVAVESCWKNGGYNTISGTSMAAPHLAGVLLLGNVTADGTVNNDPDGNADSIGVH